MGGDDRACINLSLRAYLALHEKRFSEAADLFADLVSCLEGRTSEKQDLAAALINLSECLEYAGHTDEAERHRKKAYKILSAYDRNKFKAVSKKFTEHMQNLDHIADASLGQLKVLACMHMKMGNCEQAEAIRRTISSLKHNDRLST